MYTIHAYINIYCIYMFTFMQIPYVCTNVCVRCITFIGEKFKLAIFKYISFSSVLSYLKFWTSYIIFVREHLYGTYTSK